MTDPLTTEQIELLRFIAEYPLVIEEHTDKPTTKGAAA